MMAAIKKRGPKTWLLVRTLQTSPVREKETQGNTTTVKKLKTKKNKNSPTAFSVSVFKAKILTQN